MTLTAVESTNRRVPDKDVYTVTVGVTSPGVTGFKLYVSPDDRLPSKGPGRAPNGNAPV